MHCGVYNIVIMILFESVCHLMYMRLCMMFVCVYDIVCMLVYNYRSNFDYLLDNIYYYRGSSFTIG